MARVIAFCGGDGGVGCTMVAQSVAEVLSEKRAGQVLMVNASGKFGDDYFLNREDYSMDMISANLMSGHLKPTDLYPALVKNQNLRILPGLRDVLTASLYREDCMETLIKGAEGFSEIIIDCGSRMDYGMFVSGVRSADRVFFVVNQQEKCVRRFQYIVKEVLRPLGIEGKLVMNGYRASATMLSAGEWENLTGWEVAARIPAVADGWQAEMEHVTLMKLSGRFGRAVKKLTAEIQCEKPGGWRRFAFRKEAGVGGEV